MTSILYCVGCFKRTNKEDTQSEPPMAPTLIMGIDLGGTNAKLGLLTVDGQLVKLCRAAVADRTPEGVVALLLSLAEQLLNDSNNTWEAVAAIGFGSPGQILDGRVVAAANFPSWRNVPLAKMLEDATGKPVCLLNDANAAIMGELWVGNGRGRKNAVMLTLGTGVGVGIVLDGKVWSGSRGLVEGGHMIVQPNGRLCGCGQRGCLETYTSAPNVVKRAAEAMASGEASSLSTIPNMTVEDVFAAARDGDALACRIIHETAEYLGIGVINLCRVVDPEVVILAGGMAEAGPQLLEKVHAAQRAHGWTILDNEVEMVLASLGQDAGVIGAAAAAKFLVSK